MSIWLNREEQHRFRDGVWTWNHKKNKLSFLANAEPYGTASNAELIRQQFLNTNGLSFREELNEPSEAIFRRYFQRSNNDDGDTILLQDIKHIVLFNTVGGLNNKLVAFFHTAIFDKLLYSTIVYFQHFIEVFEVLMVRRKKTDENLGANAKIRDQQSINVEWILLKQLSHRRLVMGREYGKIILGLDPSLKEFKHNTVNAEAIFRESIIDFLTHCTWISLHRWNYHAIKYEMNRIHRTKYFNLARNSCLYNFTKREEQILFGYCDYKNTMKSCLHQSSPLAAEVLLMQPEDRQIFKLGEEKYQGCNLYLLELELYYITPEPDLHLHKIKVGILGHPKRYYDSMLNLNKHSIKMTNFQKDNDPYGFNQERFALKLHMNNNFLEKYEKFPNSILFKEKKQEGVSDLIKLWQRKEQIVNRLLNVSISSSFTNE